MELRVANPDEWTAGASCVIGVCMDVNHDAGTIEIVWERHPDLEGRFAYLEAAVRKLAREADVEVNLLTDHATP